ncbi:MAG: rhamnulokinase [Clostridia bacterium]|nr:rhamnulokinase [Clostridia bacterium]
MLGTFDGEKLELSELHRFSNDPVMLGGRFVWDVPRLFFEMKAALLKAARAGIEIDAIGIDTWGVDYGLLDKNGALLGIPTHYRDARTDGIMDKAFEVMPKEAIFEETGLAFIQFNTLYQLYTQKLQGDPTLPAAEHMLMMPDLLAYFLTGEIATEYTIASTSQMIDPHTRDWAWKVIDAFGLPRRIFTKIQPAGTVRGTLLKSIADEVGMAQVPVIAVGSHDTASAVAAVPAREGSHFAYISSGTWSLFGAEIAEPLSSVEVMNANYTNEGGINGTTRLLKNIMGLWIIQECKREWDRRADAVDFAGLVKLAEQAPAFKAVIDVDDPRFMAPGDMPARIQAYCREKGQPVPEGRGEISRVIYESLALKYRWAIERLEAMLNEKIDVLHIVGGGSKNEMLNRMTASAIRRPVVAGPGEGTVIGNLLVQAMALGAVENLPELRRVVAASFENATFQPEGDPAAWDAAYARLLALMG